MQVARAGADASSKALSLEEYDTSRWAAVVRGVTELSAVCNGPASSEGLPVAELSVVPATEVSSARNGPASSEALDVDTGGGAGHRKERGRGGASGDWKIVEDVDQGGEGEIVQDDEDKGKDVNDDGDDEEEDGEEEGGKEDEEWGVDRFVIKPADGDEIGDEYEDGCDSSNDWFVRFRFEVSPYTGRLHILNIDGDAVSLNPFLSISPHMHGMQRSLHPALFLNSTRVHACDSGHLKLYLNPKPNTRAHM